jgi:hypothetical protein
MNEFEGSATVLLTFLHWLFPQWENKFTVKFESV